MNILSSDIIQYKINAKVKFASDFIDDNRGKPLFLICFNSIENISLSDFIDLVVKTIEKEIYQNSFPYKLYIIGDEHNLLMGICPKNNSEFGVLPNIDNIMGNLFHHVNKQKFCRFDFGIGRTQCNFVSDTEEILNELTHTANQNLKDNVTRWNWTFFNKTHDFFADEASNTVIQPIIFYDYKSETFNIKGGEVFIGSSYYPTYAELIAHIPEDKDINRVELLILEKLISSCQNAAGLLKFNISPQTLIDTFSSWEKVRKFIDLLEKEKISTKSFRFELIEKPYEEKGITLKEVCEKFYKFDVTFAADDFGVKNQSHQIVLELGKMIREFKLDPISFKFKAEEDHTKFLDNLAFIEYCKRLADNREAIITAEAVEDYDTLTFLITHHIHYFQTNILCNKITIDEYKKLFNKMQELPESAVRHILTDDNLFEELQKKGNIFKLAKELQLY
ncbi:MAG: EAL domain-containing protein [Spirochaetia bacterium]|nr:EAL domain-containing protein [Spirochaetia bacterium]